MRVGGWCGLGVEMGYVEERFAGRDTGVAIRCACGRALEGVPTFFRLIHWRGVQRARGPRPHPGTFVWSTQGPEAQHDRPVAEWSVPYQVFLR